MIDPTGLQNKHAKGCDDIGENAGRLRGARIP